MDENPYKSPQTEAKLADPPPESTSESRLWLIIVPVGVGILIGLILLAPFCRGPGDPTGRLVGLVCGGLAGLVVGITLSVWRGQS